MISEIYPKAAEIAEIGEGVLARTFPADRFHHREHLIMMVYLLLQYPMRDWRADLPEVIRGYNVAAGGVNDDVRGYHHTISMAFLTIVGMIASKTRREGLVATCRVVLASPAASQDVLLQFWSRDVLFSKEARREWVPPNLRALEVDFMTTAVA